MAKFYTVEAHSEALGKTQTQQYARIQPYNQQHAQMMADRFANRLNKDPKSKAKDWKGVTNQNTITGTN
jgi:hypothetical protein